MKRTGILGFISFQIFHSLLPPYAYVVRTYFEIISFSVVSCSAYLSFFPTFFSCGIICAYIVENCCATIAYEMMGDKKCQHFQQILFCFFFSQISNHIRAQSKHTPNFWWTGTARAWLHTEFNSFRVHCSRWRAEKCSKQQIFGLIAALRYKKHERNGVHWRSTAASA